jgi:hypothetical protein
MSCRFSAVARMLIISMATQKFMGRGQLIDRLSAQMGSKEAALDVLRSRGHVDALGNLTEAGRARDAMTAEERALDRAKKRTGNPVSAFKYDPATNRATLKKRY